MDTSIIGTKSSAKETPTVEPVKIANREQTSDKVDSGAKKTSNPGTPKAPVGKSDRKAESGTKDVTVTVKDTKPTTAEEPKVLDSTTEISESKVTEPKKPTKADLAKAIYDEMVKQPNPSRRDIVARFKKEANLTTAGAQSYYYKFQQESGRVINKGSTKMDKACEVFQALMKEGRSRKEIISTLIRDVSLTKAGAQTYYQTLKKKAQKPTE